MVVLCLSSAAGPARRSQIQSDLAMVRPQGLNTGLSYGSHLVLALRHSTSRLPSWMTSNVFIIAEHITQLVISTPGLFLVLASRLMDEIQPYRW